MVTKKDKPRSPRGRQILPTPVKKIAVENDIRVFSPDALKDSSFHESLNKIKIRFHVVLAYGKMIPKEIFEVPPLGAVNFHASLLPKLRGASPIETALLENHDQTGWSLQKINEGLDAGDVLYQSAVEITWEDDQGSLHSKMKKLLLTCANDSLYAFSEGRLKANPQERGLATFCTKLRSESGNIDWRKNAIQVRNQARALIPRLSVFTCFKDQKIKIFFDLKTSLDEIKKTQYKAPPGTIIIGKQGLLVVCGDGFALPMDRVQLSGKTVIQVKDFINGYLKLKVPKEKAASQTPGNRLSFTAC